MINFAVSSSSVLVVGGRQELNVCRPSHPLSVHHSAEWPSYTDWLKKKMLMGMRPVANAIREIITAGGFNCSCDTPAKHGHILANCIRYWLGVGGSDWANGKRMPCLSIMQPWAWLICAGIKDVENRKWAPMIRGRILIHASQTIDWEGYEWLLQQDLGFQLPAMPFYPLGCIIGSAVLSDCVMESDSRWFAGPYGLVMEYPQLYPLMPAKGSSKIFHTTYKKGLMSMEPQAKIEKMLIKSMKMKFYHQWKPC